MAEKHIVRFWRGTRKSFNILANNGKLDNWVRYTIQENDGSWSEYFGSEMFSVSTGQLLPVIDIVSSLPSGCSKGDRYIVGRDATFNDDGTIKNDATYYLVCCGEDGASEAQIQPFTDNHSVRVRNRNLKCYQIVNGKMITYDEVDGGNF